MERIPHVSMEIKRLPVPDKVVFGNKVITDLTTNSGTFKNLPIIPAELSWFACKRQKLQRRIYSMSAN